METIIIPATKPRFPALGKSNDEGMVVLFSNETSGTVISSGKSITVVGFFTKDWQPVTDSIVWEILPEITIYFRT